MAWVASPFGALAVWAGVAGLILLVVLAAALVFRSRWGFGWGRLALAEALWLALVAALWVSVNLASLGWIPVSPAGGPGTGVVVSVEGFMWGYSIEPGEVPLGVPVVFEASSRDTMHSFAVYSPGGELLFTVMLMPERVERFTYVFEEPGVYVVRCLEFCGVGHAFMAGEIVVGG